MTLRSLSPSPPHCPLLGRAASDGVTPGCHLSVNNSVTCLSDVKHDMMWHTHDTACSESDFGKPCQKGLVPVTRARACGEQLGHTSVQHTCMAREEGCDGREDLVLSGGQAGCPNMSRFGVWLCLRCTLRSPRQTLHPMAVFQRVLCSGCGLPTARMFSHSEDFFATAQTYPGRGRVHGQNTTRWRFCF